MSSPWRRFVLLGALAALGCAGARRDETGARAGAASDAPVLVARVADRPVTLAYYEERLAKMDRQFLPDTLDLAGKRRFLDFILNKELMAQKATEMKLDQDSSIVSTLRILRNNLLGNAAIDELCKGKLDVTDQDIEKYMAVRRNKIRAKQILVKTGREAAELRRQLLAGADFDSLAAKHSLTQNDPAQQPLMQPEVDLMYGETVMTIESAVIGLPIGDISEPVWTALGWHIFKPISTTPVERPALVGDERRDAEVKIQLRRKREIVEAYYESIAAEHGFQLDEDALHVIYDKLPPDVDPSERPARETEVKPILPFSEAERQMRLFDLDGKTHTLSDFSERYDDTSWFERPKRNTGVIGVRYWIRDRWLKDLQLERAERDGVGRLPSVAGEIDMRREQMMVSTLHARLITNQAPEPTEAQIQEFYEKYKSAYVEPEKRRCNVVYNIQEKIVRRAWDEVKAGADFVETAVRYNEGASERKHVQTALFARNNPDFAEIADMAFTMMLGQYSDPFRGKTGWAVIQVDSIVPEQQLTLEKVRDNVVADFKTLWGEERLNELLAQWKKEIPIEVYEDVLARAEVRREDVFVPGRTPAEASKPQSGDAP